MAQEICIVLDEKDPSKPIFVEIEKLNGESISIGKRSYEEGSGLCHLIISIDDIRNI